MTVVGILERCLGASATFGQIQEDLNYNKTTLSGVLKNLLDTRRLKRVQFGMYLITEVGAEYLEEKYSKIADDHNRRIMLATINILDNRGMDNLISVWPSDEKLLPNQDKIKVSSLFDLLLNTYEMSVGEEYGKFLSKQANRLVLNYSVVPYEKMCQVTWLCFKTKNIPKPMHRTLIQETDGFSNLDRIEKICDRKISERYIFDMFRFFSFPTLARRNYIRNKSKIFEELGMTNE